MVDIPVSSRRSLAIVAIIVGALLLTWLTLSVFVGNRDGRLSDLALGLYGGGCLVVALIRGWRGNPRLLKAVATGVLVSIATLLTSWQQLGTERGMESKWRHFRLHQGYFDLEKLLDAHRKQHGAYPASLAALDDLADETTDEVIDGQHVVDGWGHPFQYEPTQDGYRLLTLGRDGQPGGIGLDADIDLADMSERGVVYLPLWQFLFECYGSPIVRAMAILAGVLAASIWYATLASHSEPAVSEVDQQLNRWVQLLVIVGSSVGVAVVLAAFYLAASQSGH